MSLVELPEPLSLAIAAVAVSLAFGLGSLLEGGVVAFALSSLAAVLAVIPHELAHRGAARRMGMEGRYVLHPIGLALTLASALPFIPLKVVMPGVTLVFPLFYVEPGEARRIDGVVSLAGPATNIAIATACSAALALWGWGHPLAWLATYEVGLVSSWVALFNLLPVPPLDGYKVLRWRPPLYLFALAVSLGLFIYLSSL
ncbi:MAG: site-2 protease family protein [Desulfurococcaceae archaeon]